MNKFEYYKNRIVNSSGHQENFQIAIDYDKCSYEELSVDERGILQDMLNAWEYPKK